MARIRTVKPEFFKHHELFLAEQETKLPLRLAYEGLWICADKEGRFKYNPTVLKLDILPYDQLDFRAVLAALEAYGFILQYTVDSKRYGIIPTLKDHQRFSGSEAKSESRLPAPPKNLKSGISKEELRNRWGSSMELPENDHDDLFDDECFESKEVPGIFQGISEERRKGEKEGNKERIKEGEGTALPLPDQYLGIVVYDAEQEILNSQIRFEQICITTGRDPTSAKTALRKYHLWLIDKEQYPKGKQAVYAGFEKWLMNEKKTMNGSESKPKKGGRSAGAYQLLDDLNKDIGQGGGGDSDG